MSIEVKYKEPTDRPIETIRLKNVNNYEVCYLTVDGIGQALLRTPYRGGSAAMSPHDLRTLADILHALARQLERTT